MSLGHRGAASLLVLTLLLLPALAAATTTQSNASEPQPTSVSTLYLMRNENYLYLKATSNVAQCTVKYVFPPDYQYQTPVFIEIINTTAPIIKSDIVNDTDGINKLASFTIGPLTANQTVLIQFNSWGLVNPNDYRDLPKYVRFPRLKDLPAETWPWLTPSKVVQSHSIPIQREAFELQRGTTNLIRYANRVMRFIHFHHKSLYFFEYKTGTLHGQDAKTVLRRSGDCPGRAHLASALMRAHGVPARSVMVSEHNSYWVEMHFMSEYYCPGYGWILSQVHKGTTPTIQNNDLILRICTPYDEAHTHKDALFPKMTGEEPWIWIDTPAVTTVYTKTMDKSRQNMFPEGNHTTDPGTADYTMSLTRMIFRSYQYYHSQNLTGDNLQHYRNAVLDIHRAVYIFQTTTGLTDYLADMNLAYQEFQQIV